MDVPEPALNELLWVPVWPWQHRLIYPACWVDSTICAELCAVATILPPELKLAQICLYELQSLYVRRWSSHQAEASSALEQGLPCSLLGVAVG